jgi:hypothetical protein
VGENIKRFGDLIYFNSEKEFQEREKLREALVRALQVTQEGATVHIGELLVTKAASFKRELEVLH